MRERQRNAWLLVLLVRLAPAARCANTRADAFINYAERERSTEPAAVAPVLAEADVAAVALTTTYGKIRLRLRRDWAPTACQLVAQLALKGCSACVFYRHEPNPEGWGVGGFYGPPYGLLQGGFSELGKSPPTENTKGLAVQKGRAAFITGTSEFFIGSVDHSEWGAAFIVFAETVAGADMEAVAAVPTEPYTNSTDSNNITTRWLVSRIPFKVQALTVEQLLAEGVQAAQ